MAVSSILAFLTARLDEAQALAEAAQKIDPAPWSAGVDEEGPGPHGRAVQGNGMVIAADEVGLWDCEGSFTLCMTVPTTRHVAHWDPARVLREIEAKRELLAEIASWKHDYVDGDTWFSCAQAVNPFDKDGAPGSGCSNEHRAGEPCDCGLDRRRKKILKALAKPYADHPDHPSV